MNKASKSTADELRAALEAADLDLLAPLMDPAVRWGGEEETPETCHGREEVIAWYGKLREAGVGVSVSEVVDLGDAVVLGLAVTGPDHGEFADVPPVVFQVFRLTEGMVVDIRGFPEREDALSWASGTSS